MSTLITPRHLLSTARQGLDFEKQLHEASLGETATNDSLLHTARASHTAFQRINGRYLELIREIHNHPDLLPGKDTVISRYRHMSQMVNDAPEWAQSFNLDQEETLLAGVCDFAHDGGRLLEFLHRIDSTETGHAPHHSKLSVEILDRSNALEDYSTEYRDVIRNAVLSHAVKEVDQSLLPKDSLGWKLCYMIRDDDKLDILVYGMKSYFDPKGIETCCSRFFFSAWFENWEGLRDDKQFHEIAFDEIQRALTDHSPRTGISSPTIESNVSNAELPADRPDEIRKAVRMFMDAPIYPDALTDLLNGKSIDAADMWRSQATYWAGQIAMIEDLQTPKALEIAYESGAISRRLKFLKPRVSDSDFKQIANVMANHISSKTSSLGSHDKIQQSLITF